MKMNMTLRVGRPLRRGASVTTGTVVAAGMIIALMAPGAAATGGGSSGGSNLDCPAGTTLLAELNVTEGTGAYEYEYEFGDEVVTATPSDEFSGSFTVASGFTVSQVIVKGSGVDAKRDTDGNLTFDGEGLLNGGGNQPTISNVKFCGATDGATDGPTVARVANGDGATDGPTVARVDGGGGGGGGGGGLKVFVCTYVGTPGVDERLQPGNNPISMSVKAIPGGLPVNIGDEFANGQVRSVVIAFDTRTDAEPSVDDCPTVPMPVLTKSAGPESGSVVRPGDEIEYTVTVANTGELALDDQTLVDTLPEGVTVVEGEDGLSLFSTKFSPSFGEVSLDEALGEITWEFDLPGETSYVMTYTVIVDADAADGDVLTNTATWGGLVKFTTHTVNVPVQGGETGVPVLTKSAGPESGSEVRPGSKIEYTVTVANTGKLALDDQTLVDTLPEGVTVVEGEDGLSLFSTKFSPSFGEVSLDEALGEITWEFDLPGETSYVMIYTVIVDADAADGDVLTNTATWGGLAEFTTHTVNVPQQGGPAAPFLSKSAGPGSGSVVEPGDEIEYAVTVVNNRWRNLYDQTLVDTLPEGVTVVGGIDGFSFFEVNLDGELSPGYFGEVTLDQALGEITWEFDLPGETSYIMIYTVVVDADAVDGDVLTNTATWGELVKLTTHTVKVDVVAPAAVTPIAPMAIPSVCVGNASNGASAVEIFPATGVEYSIGSTVLAAKITDVADGTTVTVVARPTANNVFAGAPSVSYVLTFGTPNCTPASGVVVNPPPAPAVVVAAPVRVIPSVTQAAAQPRALARTGVELWSVALTAGLLLAAGAAMVGLTTTGNAKGRHRA